MSTHDTRDNRDTGRGQLQAPKDGAFQNSPMKYRVDADDQIVLLRYGISKVEIRFKEEPGKANVYSLDTDSGKYEKLGTITTKSFKDFSMALKPYLDKEFTVVRPSATSILSPLYSEWIDGTKSQFKKPNFSAFKSDPSIDDWCFPGPAPRSYLQVLSLRAQERSLRNGEPQEIAERKGLLCLSFVKSRFAMYFGVKPAIDFGLFGQSGTGLARDYIPDSKFFTETNYQGRDIRPGSIVKLRGRGASETTHIGIITPDGFVEHLVGQTLYKEPIDKTLGSGWEIERVFTLKKDTRPVYDDKSIDTLVKPTQKEYGKRTSIDQIAQDIINTYPYFKGMNADKAIMVVQETIYSMNQDKFRMGRDRQGTLAAYPKYDGFHFYVPASWFEKHK